MNWVPKIEELKLVIVNATGLAAYDEEKCKFCGHYGCTDRGYTFYSENPQQNSIVESKWTDQLQEKLADIIEANKQDVNVHFTSLTVPQCVRKLKKSNALATLQKLKSCGPDCRRNMNCASNGIDGGVWQQRDENYQCPFRDRKKVCQRNWTLDYSPFVCEINDEDLMECEFHEEAYRRCFRRKEGEPCYNLKEKLGFTHKKNDKLLMLVHRFSAAPCRHCNDGSCTNPTSQHHEGMCVLNGLMAPCNQYEAAEPDQTYTEGVYTSVSSTDGKDDRLIFPSSNYACKLSPEQRETLCMACRISHTIAQATGLKCLGVRRASKNPFLNQENPLIDKTIQINYLYLTHPEDVAKYDPEQIAQAVYDAINSDCAGMECEEYQSCNFNSM